MCPSSTLNSGQPSARSQLTSWGRPRSCSPHSAGPEKPCRSSPLARSSPSARLRLRSRTGAPIPGGTSYRCAILRYCLTIAGLLLYYSSDRTTAFLTVVHYAVAVSNGPTPCPVLGDDNIGRYCDVPVAIFANFLRRCLHDGSKYVAASPLAPHTLHTEKPYIQ